MHAWNRLHGLWRALSADQTAADGLAFAPAAEAVVASAEDATKAMADALELLGDSQLYCVQPYGLLV